MARIQLLLSIPILLLLQFPVYSQIPDSTDFITWVEGKDAQLAKQLQDPQKGVQIIYTRIDRSRDSARPRFDSRYFFPEHPKYFYPASTVKFPVAVLALEKIEALGIHGLDMYSPMQTLTDRRLQTPEFLDPSSSSGFRSVDEYLHQIFVVSDNNAYNRLYEFLGQEEIDRGLRRRGLDKHRIIHRLSLPHFDTLENKYLNPVRFYGEGGQLLYHRGGAYQERPPRNSPDSLAGQMAGKGYYDSRLDKVVPAPFDFHHKNYLALTDLHDVLLRVMFPQVFPAHLRFNIADSSLHRLWQHMGTWPYESHRKEYHELPEDYNTFFLPEGSKPEDFRIFSKVGFAYGTLTEAAYIVDLKNGVEYILAATIQVNENQIYNDDQYEYDTVGLPVLKKLSTLIYQNELRQTRPVPSGLHQIRELFGGERSKQ